MIVRVSHGPARAVLLGLLAILSVDEAAVTVGPFFPYIVAILILECKRTK